MNWVPALLVAVRIALVALLFVIGARRIRKVGRA